MKHLAAIIAKEILSGLISGRINGDASSTLKEVLPFEVFTSLTAGDYIIKGLLCLPWLLIECITYFSLR